MTKEELQKKLSEAEDTIRILKEELDDTNRGMIALSIDFENRVERRTEKLNELNKNLKVQIEKRIAALQQFAESEKKYFDLYNNAPNMYISVDPKTTRIVQFNQTLADTLGYTRDELLGADIFKVYHPDSMREAEKVFNTFIETGTVKDAELKLARKDGSSIDTILNVSAVRDQFGNIIMSNSVWVDITEKKRMERELFRVNQELESRVIQRTAELEAAIRELEAFSYSVSHDLRAPLRTINGFSQVLLEDFGESLTETAQDYLERINNASDNMGKLIDGLLRLSRISRQEINRKTNDATEIAIEIINELELSDPDRNVEWDIQQNMLAKADPELFKVVLQNILWNAWKFTRNKRKSKIKFTILNNTDTNAKDNSDNVFCVKDNGAGFNMEYVSKIFEPFQRLHSDMDYSGTGIGMATVKRVINRHGGRIWAEGAVGKGASVFFTLPE